MKKLMVALTLFCVAAVQAFCLPSLYKRELFKVNDIQNFDFDLSWENLVIQECDESKNILIEIYCKKPKYAPTVKKTGSTIVVKSNQDNHFSVFGSNNCTVIARIPEGAKFEKFFMGTTSGSIRSQVEIEANIVSSNSTSGSQSITEDLISENASFYSTSGSVFLENFYGQTLKVSATSGSINVHNFSGKSCSLKATSGSVTLEGSVSDSFDISTTSGSIGLELNDAPRKNSSAGCTSGSIFIGLPGDADFSLDVETTSGSFVNALTRTKIDSHVEFKGDINNGGAVISLSTTSGSVSIDSTNGKRAKATQYTSDSDSDSDVPVVSFDDPIF